MKVLIASGNPIAIDKIARLFLKNHYSADVARYGKSAREMLSGALYDLLILDSVLSDMPGTTLLKKIRLQDQRIPIIFLNQRDNVDAKIEILECGADEYLSEPYACEELIAIARCLLRRSLLITQDNCLCAGRLALRLNACEVRVGTERFQLTVKEAEILTLLIKNANNYVSKDRMMNTVWGMYRDIEPGNIEIYIHRLRKSPFYKKAGIVIHTRRGIGYCLKEETVR